MHGFEYRWLLLNPVMRGVFLSIAVAAFCASCLLLDSASTPPPASPDTALTLAATVPTEAEVDWPQTALRLWFLVPQVAPLSPR
jgi:hypothetical protein